MFRLHNKLKSQKSEERRRFDFKFFNFHALQVPRGWDKLYVSIVSTETGKTLTKSAKAAVKNGSCQWTETLSESIWIWQMDVPKPSEDCLVKILVSMGSARSDILGEATINLGSYKNSKTAVAVSLPLRKCNYGTILQLKIQCQSPSAKFRGERPEEKSSQTKQANIDYDDVESISDVSDSSLTKSVGSSSSNHMDSSSHAGEELSRDFGFLASGSRYSFDSTDSYLSRETYSPRNNMTAIANNQIERQDSDGSLYSSRGSYSCNDSGRSNRSSFNSKVSASRSGLQIQRDDFNQVSQSVASSPLRNDGSSKDLLEAAEAKIEELRAEARMWEQNARKLMNDVQKLEKELMEQSNHQASLAVELTESHRVCDDLKQEIKQVKVLLEESMVKQKSLENMEFQANEMCNIQKALQDEVRFEKELNANLALQLKKSQEANVELVSILQELEDTIEKQKLEIANLSNMPPADKEILVSGTTEVSCISDPEGSTIVGDSPAIPKREEWRNTDLDMQKFRESQKNLECTTQFLEKSLLEKNQELEAAQGSKSQILQDPEAQWRDKLARREEEIITLESKLSEAIKANNLGNGIDNDLAKEVEVLKRKIQELEKDCNELTDENLELLLKLKQSECDLPTCVASSNSFSNKRVDHGSPSITESELSKLKSQVCMFEEELNKKDMLIEQLSSNNLQIHCTELENKCANLELKLQTFQDKTSYLELLEGEHCKYRDRAEDQGIQTTTSYFSDIEVSQSNDAVEICKTLSELNEQIQSCLANLKKQQLNFNAPTRKENYYSCSNSQIANATNSCDQKEQVVSILNSFIQLKDLLEAEATTYNGEVKQTGEIRATAVFANDVQKLEHYELKENTFSFSTYKFAQDSLQFKSKPEITDSGTQILEIKSETDERKSDLFVEGTSNIETPAKKLELGSSEIEYHLSELEKENVELSERICGLEAQLRYITDERELSRLGLQNSESCALNLQEEVRKLESDLEAEKCDKKYKLQEMQNQWLQAQSEVEYLKIANIKLQSTAESLIDESCLLQKSIVNLRKRKMELQQHSAILEAELRESQKGYSDLLKGIEALEAKYILMLEEIAKTEKALGLEVDALHRDNEQYSEKLIEEEHLLNRIYFEKDVEIQNLHKHIAQLTEHMSATQDEQERASSAAVLEVSRLRADKSALESSLQNVQERLELAERNLSALRMESGTKLLELQDKLAASKQNQEILIADNEKLLELLEDVKSSGDEHKSIVRGLQIKLKASAYEKLELEEEISSLCTQLQKTALLENEILAVKKSLNEVQFDNQRLEISLQMLSQDNEELKAMKVQLLQMISDMQMAVSELEHFKHSKACLEEKVLRLEGDLTAREALGALDAELKNELARVKRANNELRRKIRHVQEENQEYISRAQVFKTGESEQKIEKNPDAEKSTGASRHLHPESDVINRFTSHELKLSQVDYKCNCAHGSSQVAENDSSSKMLLLETKLAQALEANDMYKAQLKSLLLEGCSKGLENLADKNEASEQVDEVNVSSLKIELRDLQERYFHLSLKCAEVESQREQLVLKLRTMCNKNF